MAIKIRQDKNIKGINLSNNSQITISQLADDTTIFLNSTKSISSLLKLLENFATCSGLKTNVEKTKVHNIGATDINSQELHGMKLDQEAIKLLGITLAANEKYRVQFFAKTEVDAEYTKAVVTKKFIAQGQNYGN